MAREYSTFGDSAFDVWMRVIWKESLKGIGKSWEVLNRSMQNAMNLAITSGFKFAPSDLDCLEKFNPGRWFDGEGHYRSAVSSRNVSACIAIENYCGRVAFIVDYVNGAGYRRVDNVSRGRVCVGSEFHWAGEQVTVTSIGTDSFIACSYWGKTVSTERAKIKRRYTVTKQDIVNERKARKDAGVE